ncbi:MAG: class I SAM-dependent RNA methyltransferase [Tissierellia bacterium]|nr:class I SAM-dependent RNA methyltransferase [Tissierellia bacterium]
MKKYRIRIVMAFGLESLTKWQLEKMGYEDFTVNNGYIELEGTAEDIIKLNIHLRTADRVYIVLKEFKADSFEDLFQGVQEIEWGKWMAEDANFIVNGKAHQAKLFSIRDCQSIIEKAMIGKMKEIYPIDWFPKTGSRYKIRFRNHKDRTILMVDTSGEGLHKRGYRIESGRAPLRENLASALVELSFYQRDRFFVDLFCGSGTIAIEAARFARNIAPGIDRDFDCVHWSKEWQKIYKKERAKAMDAIDYGGKLHILASDIDGGIVRRAIENAESAGVREDIDFITRDFRQIALSDDYGVLITNPPYGDRFMDKKKAEEILLDLGEKMKQLNTWSWYILTDEKKLESLIGKKANRKRKLFNGPIETTFYQYYGPRPPKK